MRPLPLKSGLARSWVRLALGSRRPLRVGSCVFASGQTGNVFYGLQGTLVYPSYPVYPLYPVESAVDAGPLCLQCALVYPSYPVYPSYVVTWERDTLGSGTSAKGQSQERRKARKQEQSGNGESQEKGNVRKQERSGNPLESAVDTETLVYSAL